MGNKLCGKKSMLAFDLKKPSLLGWVILSLAVLCGCSEEPEQAGSAADSPPVAPELSPEEQQEKQAEIVRVEAVKKLDLQAIVARARSARDARVAELREANPEMAQADLEALLEADEVLCGLRQKVAEADAAFEAQRVELRTELKKQMYEIPNPQREAELAEVQAREKAQRAAKAQAKRDRLATAEARAARVHAQAKAQAEKAAAEAAAKKADPGGASPAETK